MQSVYAQYMTGVTSDFALNIRKCPPLPGSSSNSSSSSSSGGANSSSQPAGHVLAVIRERHPAIFRCVCVLTQADGICIQPAVQGHKKPARSGVCCAATCLSGQGPSRNGTKAGVRREHLVNAQCECASRHAVPCCVVLCSQLTQRTSRQIQAIEPLGSAVLEALQEFNDYTPPQVRCGGGAAAHLR
jgi:hypothetical protein